MAIKTLQEILENASKIIGENTSDEALTFLEDITDTFNNNNGDVSRAEYDELDRTWRARYKERFLSGDTSIDDTIGDDPEPEPVKTYNYADLFKEG